MIFDYKAYSRLLNEFIIEGREDRTVPLAPIQ